jgi:catalase
MTGVQGNITGRKIAILVAEGSSASDVASVQTALAKAGAVGLVIGARLGTMKGDGGPITIDHTSLTMPSVVFDGFYVPGGARAAQTLATSGLTISTIAEGYKHLKAIAMGYEAAELLLPKAGIFIDDPAANGVFVGDAKAVTRSFLTALGEHRVWARTNLEAVPA